MKKKNKDKSFLEEVRDEAAVLFPKETFELPKLKEFEMTIHFYSDKPNKITYDSRD
jgi:hypothetical protein|tara:strand:- start:175 stop:342 length:168 start_codon:yes stop_codon:yes gene_type:complete